MTATVRAPVRTVIVGELPAEVQELIERRQRLGLDRRDEVWEGDYHVAPAPHVWHALMETSLVLALAGHATRGGLVYSGGFNLGTGKQDFRVPDAGVHVSPRDAVYVPTALLVVEILSPGDESYDKFDFYASRGVREIVVVDPRERLLQWWALDASGTAYGLVDRSEVLDVAVAEVAADLTWPG